MFKSKITTLVMLASVVCGSIFLAVNEYIQGRSDWAEWMYPTIMGIIGLGFVLYARVKKNRGKK